MKRDKRERERERESRRGKERESEEREIARIIISIQSSVHESLFLFKLTETFK